MIVGRQIKAARALIDMSQDELAQAAGLTPQAIRKIESGEAKPREGTISDIMRVFTERGVEFTDNTGVKLKPQGVEVLVGPRGFIQFYDAVYNYLRDNGGDVCVSGVDERLFEKHRPEGDIHRKRMVEMVKQNKPINMRILIQEGDRYFTASDYATYHWQEKEFFSGTPFYVFGDHLALISFSHEPAPLVILIKSAPIAEAYRQSFNLAWAGSSIPSANKE